MKEPGTAVSLQKRRPREWLHRQECRVRQALEAARAAVTQAAVMHRSSNERANLQLLESETGLRVPTWEGLGREQVLWEAMCAKRQLEVFI